MLEFRALVNRKKNLESVSGQNNVASKLYYRNTSVKDLCLDFTLPGYSDYELSSEVTKVVMITVEECAVISCAFHVTILDFFFVGEYCQLGGIC